MHHIAICRKKILLASSALYEGNADPADDYGPLSELAIIRTPLLQQPRIRSPADGDALLLPHPIDARIYSPGRVIDHLGLLMLPGQVEPAYRDNRDSCERLFAASRCGERGIHRAGSAGGGNFCSPCTALGGRTKRTSTGRFHRRERRRGEGALIAWGWPIFSAPRGTPGQRRTGDPAGES